MSTAPLDVNICPICGEGFVPGERQAHEIDADLTPAAMRHYHQECRELGAHRRSIVVTYPYWKAEGFLAALRPSNLTMWGQSPLAWIFRGQTKAEWTLEPTIFRNNRWRDWGGMHPFSGHGPENDAPHRRAEYRAISDFYRAADRHGLGTTEDSPLVMSVAELQKTIAASEDWPPRELLLVTALAQHYGVPTRLLDWSWKPFVAAYFAASGAAKSKEGGDLAVWALPTKRMEIGAGPVRLITAPQASNPHLAAQAGMFTLTPRTAPNYVRFRDLRLTYATRVRAAFPARAQRLAALRGLGISQTSPARARRW